MALITICVDDVRQNIKEIINKVLEFNSDVIWVLSDTDMKFCNIEEYSGIGLGKEDTKEDILKKRLLKKEVVKLKGKEIIELLNSVYDFEFGIILCFEENEVGELNCVPMVGERTHEFPYTDNALMELRIYEEILDIYISDDINHVIHVVKTFA